MTYILLISFTNNLTHWNFFHVIEKRKGSILRRKELDPQTQTNHYKMQKAPTFADAFLRSRADSNRCTRFCRPLPSHSATRPFVFRNANVGNSSLIAKPVVVFPLHPERIVENHANTGEKKKPPFHEGSMRSGMDSNHRKESCGPSPRTRPPDLVV